VYANEEEAGQGIKESGLSRKDLWITTKWSGVNSSSPREACEASLEKLGVSSVDLLLIHHPRLTNGDIPGAWKKMEELHKEGKAKSIGVSKCVPAYRRTVVLRASCGLLSTTGAGLGDKP
jgi:diketogulonate reductase-like aldo/keto reductase